MKHLKKMRAGKCFKMVSHFLKILSLMSTSRKTHELDFLIFGDLVLGISQGPPCVVADARRFSSPPNAPTPPFFAYLDFKKRHNNYKKR